MTPRRAARGKARKEGRRARREGRGAGEAEVGTLRARILDGATCAFGRLGYADTRVEDILKAAGVSRPSFYRFFRNKDEVFGALAEMNTLALLQMVRGAVGTASDPVEKLDKGVEVYLRWRVSTGPFGRVLDAEARNPSTFAHRQRQMILQGVMALFESEVRAARRTGIDPLVFVGLTAALESIGATLLDLARVSDPDIARCKKAMMRILHRALAGRGELGRLLEAEG